MDHFTGGTPLTGGDGIDTASYASAASAVTVNLATTTAQATGGAGSDTLATIENLTGSAFNDTLTGNNLANVLYGGLGNDTLTGGAGIDTFTVGSGTDTISDLGNGGADILTVASGTIANATINTAWTATSASVNSGTANITTSGLAVNLAAVRSGNGFSVMNTGVSATLTGSSGADTLTGGAGADTLVGGAGNDTLVGGDENDTLTGGLGNDTLTGGTSVDTFIFNTKLGTTNLDRITDFSVTDDTIWLENTGIFTALTTLGTLGSTSFHTGTAAGDGLDRIIYNSTNGSLFYDADGTGSTAAVQFATLTTGLALTNADFWVI